MTYTKGGRGKKAPYETTHTRIPKQIKPLVDKITSKFKELVDQPEATDTYINHIFSCINEDEDTSRSEILSKEEAIKQAQKILRSKKGNKKQQFEKLLTSIYGGDISLD